MIRRFRDEFFDLGRLLLARGYSPSASPFLAGRALHLMRINALNI